MKKIVSLCLVLVLLAGIVPWVHAAGYSNWYQPETVMLIDPSTGHILYSKNPDGKVFPASTTKLLTSLLIFEHIKDLDQVVTVDEECLSIVSETYDSTLEPMLQVGEQLTVRQLLYGMLLPSGSDCACTLAVQVGGSVTNFVSMMNQKAQQLGMTGSHFVTPHGYPNDNHFTTARDMSIVAMELMKNEVFMQIVGTPTYTLPATNMSPERNLRSTNFLVELHWGTPEAYYEYATGMKTGSSSVAGGCLVASAEKDGRQLLALIYQDQSAYREHRWLLAQDLFEWAFDQKYTYDETLLKGVSVPMTELLPYGTPTLDVDVTGFSLETFVPMLSGQITGKLVYQVPTPEPQMTVTVEYWHEDGHLVASYPGTVSIANFAIPPETTAPTETTEPSASTPQTKPTGPDAPKEPSGVLTWIGWIFAVAFFLLGNSLALAWYAGYRSVKAKLVRMEKKILRLRAQNPEDPALARLENMRRPTIQYQGLYLAAGAWAVALVLVLILL